MKININNHSWNVYKAAATNPVLMVDGLSCRGTTWCDQQEIYIAKEINKESAMRVIKHELVHAYLYSTQMNVPKKFTEEDLCEFVACWGEEIMDKAFHIYAQLYCENYKNIDAGVEKEFDLELDDEPCDVPTPSIINN